ncbi:MAG: hypothetical protein U1E05_25625, partial [Patescibacteria group bacterium]|nr:hypothetical protein [Patescibacteria group bacterium]
HLAEARASLASAHAASLITRLDDAQTGENPVGPSKAIIVLAGVAGGVLLGFSILFLTVQPASFARVAQPASTPAPAAALAAASMAEPCEEDGRPAKPDWPTEHEVLSLTQALRKVAAGAA